MRAYVLPPIALGVLVAGYLWGYGVGEREGQDSGPEDAVATGPNAAATGLSEGTAVYMAPMGRNGA